ncbi:DUF1428 domain-containing protein [Jannaschia ovalis]|uniref:DUF1428 domain-containing protein n=1 Tax=Jannaschia ovalis TaxID=3038773 RepID=A0ABY8L8B1_9RHOB|nr:DUF1428 domain-containing protein [Jannaschia sp. GRR-S6-38]WGH77602.1 DUF1428 domain-containing protein [Jannaschia sp. GRR-S6-38]
MAYFDGFVAAVPIASRADYTAFARRSWETMMRPLGARAMTETWGDDVPDGELTSFPMAVKAGPDEAVVLSWVEWPDKATRDAAWAKLSEDDFDMGAMPFDGKRMIFGGFETLVSERI